MAFFDEKFNKLSIINIFRLGGKSVIYLDNSASSFFKPSSSIDASSFCLKNLSVNAGRSSHELSIKASQIIYQTRKKLSSFFNNGNVSRVVFTLGCTMALNMAIFGLPIKNGEIVTTVTEHNSVLRPLYELKRRGVKLKIANMSSKPYVTLEDIIPLVSKNTDFVVLNAVSNVTGYENEWKKICLYLKDLGVPIILDGAQIAGHLPIDMKKYGVSVLCVPAHKGLLASQGVGALIFLEGVSISPILFGGSGTESFEQLPSCYPELLEAGTLPLPPIASFEKSIDFVSEHLQSSQKTLLNYTQFAVGALNKIKGVKVYSSKNPFGIVSFSVFDEYSVDIAEILSNSYGICVRGGFHCAPLMHTALKTEENGLVRASFSPFNTFEEIKALVLAVSNVCQKIQ